MKKNLYLMFASQVLILPLSLSIASPAFAAPMHTTASSHIVASATNEHNDAVPVSDRPRYRFWGGGEENNQSQKSCMVNSGNNTYQGNNQSNSGNSQDNGGFNQDNSGNLGNQIINRQRIRGYQRRNQHLLFCSINSNNLFYQGYKQGNSGNSGYNRGFNQDNSGNGGNQIIG